MNFSLYISSFLDLLSYMEVFIERRPNPFSVMFRSPRSGFLQITPEGSPQAKHEGAVGGEADVSGSFCFHTSGHDFTTQQLSEEHRVSCSKEATVTMVTKTTRITQKQVTAETRSDESLVTKTKTHQLTGEQL